MSLPSNPLIVSALGVPLRVSSPSVPCMLSASTKIMGGDNSEGIGTIVPYVSPLNTTTTASDNLDNKNNDNGDDDLAGENRCACVRRVVVAPSFGIIRLTIHVDADCEIKHFT